MWRALLLMTTAVVQSSTLVQAAAPVVSLDYATYQGFTNGNNITSFLGMRYAAAPTGNNRFAAPRDPPVQTVTQQATQLRGPSLTGLVALVLEMLICGSSVTSASV
jgi:acetylcholinesterase